MPERPRVDLDEQTRGEPRGLEVITRGIDNEIAQVEPMLSRGILYYAEQAPEALSLRAKTFLRQVRERLDALNLD